MIFLCGNNKLPLFFQILHVSLHYDKITIYDVKYLWLICWKNKVKSCNFKYGHQHKLKLFKIVWFLNHLKALNKGFQNQSVCRYGSSANINSQMLYVLVFVHHTLLCIDVCHHSLNVSNSSNSNISVEKNKWNLYVSLTFSEI